MNHILALLSFLGASFIFAFPASATVTIDTVTVGNAGNAADSAVMVTDGTSGYGSVNYAYRIGTHEVTNAQYAEFLNFKARSDPLGLYNTEMGGDLGGITRILAFGSYSYTTIPGRGQRPVNYVSWFDAIRFANWLHNGQAEGDTETGAYTILGGTATPSNADSITRNPGARWYLPSEDEWYKAAYHKNDGVTGNYFLYPTNSDTEPTAEAPPGGNNSANFNFPAGNLTNTGAYRGTMSPYGAFDLGGNVWEWNETLINNTFRGLRGGSFNSLANDLLSSLRNMVDPKLDNSHVFGFRVATVPEPRSLILAALGSRTK